MRRVVLVTHPACERHDPGPEHSDATSRLPALRAAARADPELAAAALLRERVILEAKRLLLYSNVGIAEAGYRLGFHDPAYFSRVFRAATGQSPRSFRRCGGRPAPDVRPAGRPDVRPEGRAEGGATGGHGPGAAR
jgi:hypothetical protein